MSVETYLDLLVLLLAGTGGAIVASQLLSPRVGMALLLVTGVLVPCLLSSGLSAPLAIALGLCVIGLVSPLVARRPLTAHNSPVVISTLCFMGVALLSFIVGQYPWFPTDHAPIRAQVGGLALFLLSGGLLLFVGHQLESVRDLERLTWLFVALGAAAIATTVVGSLNVSVGPIAVIDAYSIGSVFWTWIVGVTVSQALCNETLTPAKRVALVAVAMAAMGRSLVLALSWTSGWLPSLAVVGVVVFLRFPKFTLLMALLAITPVAIVGGTLYSDLDAGESCSSMTRSEAAGVLLDMVRRSPWLGFGPANYYHYTLLFPLIGWWVRFNSHNNYLDLLAQVGVIGLIVFFWLSGELFRLAFWLRRRLPANGFAGAYVVGAIGGLVGTLISGALADWIVPFTYNIGLTGFRSSLLFWFFMGGLLALKRLAATAPVAAVTRTTPHGAAVPWPRLNPRHARSRLYSRGTS